MKKFNSLIILCLILSYTGLFASTQVSVSLLLDEEIKPDSSIKLQVDFQIPEGIHIYSNSPQELGLPTQIELLLPESFQLKSTKWQEPTEFEYLDMKAMGYANSASVYFDVYVDKYSQGKKEILAKLSWLECSDTCNVGEVQILKSIEIEKGKTSALNYFKKLILYASMAFLGGMILNLMPCVFPIIGIKVLSFIKGAGKAKAVLSALSYSLGIVLSFLLLAGLLIVFRTMGMHYGWGFQLQEPIFVAFMILLFFAMALSFSGLFEIGTSLGNLSNNAGKDSGQFLNSFLSGVLAVLVASPCTAPYMGTAIGAVLLEDYDLFKVIIIFTSLGLGMALPYVLLTLVPSLHKFLPKSGEWLNTFKQMLSFLLYATCIWLFWVYLKQSSIDAGVLLLFAILILALGLFVYGKWQAPHFSKKCRYMAMASAIFALALSAYIATIASSQSYSEDTILEDDNSISALDKIEELRAKGEIVFVDFTAAWCVTCQSNKRLVLDTQATKNLFEKNKINFVKVDWTKRDPIIAKELKKFGVIGVPLYLLYGKNSKEAIVLPNILTYSILEEAIEELSKK